MSERFTVEVNINAKDNTGRGLNNVRRGFKEAFQEIGKGAMRFAGEGLANLAAQVPQLVGEMAQLGIQSQAVSQRFERFAGGAGRATMFLESFNEGTQNSVDRMTAMSSASRLLQMGLVGTGDEMSQIAAMATRLGDQTQSTGDRISDFAALLANQSIPRLDNFGISSGRVRQRIDELLKSGQAINREEAFKMAVMAEGAKALNTLGDTSDTAASKLAILKAAVQDAKVGMGELIVSFIEGAGSVDGFAARIRGLPTTLAQVGMLTKATFQGLRAASLFDLSAGVDEFNNSLKRSVAAQTDFGTASEVIRYAHTRTLPTYEREIEMLDALKTITQDNTSEVQYFATVQGTMQASTSKNVDSFNQYQAAINGAALATDTANFALQENIAITEQSVLSNASLAASLKDATDAQIAQAAISELGTALEEGQIDAQTYATAVQETQLAFGLADEQSIFLTDSLGALTDALADGTLSAEGYDEALGDVILESKAAGVSLDEFNASLQALPEKKIVTVEFRTTGTPPAGMGGGGGEEGNIPQFQHGGQFFVGENGPEVITVQPLTNNFTENITINGSHSAAAFEERRRRERRSLARQM